MTTMDTDSAETTIMVEVIAVKSELGKLQGDLENFLRTPACEEKQIASCFPDPISEIVANLQDCRKLVHDIHHLAFDSIASRIA